MGGTCVVSLNITVAANTDDGFEYSGAGGVVDVYSGTVRLNSTGDTAFVRFNSVPVPRGSHALHARLWLVVDSDAFSDASEQWNLQAGVSGATLGGTAHEVSQRALLSAPAVAWTEHTGMGLRVSPEFAPLVNLMFADSSWVSGSPLVFMGRRVTNSNFFYFRTFEYGAASLAAPRLELLYTLP